MRLRAVIGLSRVKTRSYGNHRLRAQCRYGSSVTDVRVPNDTKCQLAGIEINRENKAIGCPEGTPDRTYCYEVLCRHPLSEL
jgi:hypothetical protein